MIFARAFGCLILTLSACAHTYQTNRQVASDAQAKTLDLNLFPARQLFTLNPIDDSKWLITGGLLGKTTKDPGSKDVSLVSVSADGAPRVQAGIAELGFQRWGHDATVLQNGDLLVCGGTSERACEKISRSNLSVSLAGQLSHPRSGQAQLLLDDGKVLVSGGYNKGDARFGKVLSSLELYDPVTNSFSDVGDMQVARAGHYLAKLNDRVFVVGGASAAADLVEIYNVSSRLWETKPDFKLPFSVKDFRAIQSGSDLYLIGGTKPDGNSSDRVIKIDLRNLAASIMPDTLSEPREDLSLCLLSDQRALVMGGEIKGHQRDGEHSGKVDLISLNPFSIQHLSLEIYRDDAQVISLANKGCLLIGGSDKSENLIAPLSFVNLLN